MLRRPLVLLGSLALAAVLAGGALGAAVKVRVEGKTTTIYGAAQPTVEAANPLQALEAASLAGEFYYGITASSFGDYVSQIGRYGGSESTGWVFKVNGVSPPVGADKVELKAGDVVLWYYATFGPAGGPPTLDLQRLPGNCYLVSSVSDAGKRSAAGGAMLVVDARRVRAGANGRACIGRHTGLVRAVLAGSVRSNAVQ